MTLSPEINLDEEATSRLLNILLLLWHRVSFASFYLFETEFLISGVTVLSSEKNSRNFLIAIEIFPFPVMDLDGAVVFYRVLKKDVRLQVLLV